MEVQNDQVLVDRNWLRELFAFVSTQLVENVQGNQADHSGRLNQLHGEIQLYIASKPASAQVQQPERSGYVAEQTQQPTDEGVTQAPEDEDPKVTHRF